MSTNKISWTTNDELHWIATLGQHNALTQVMPRKQLLQAAIAGCQRRARWDAIDRQKVLTLAFTQLTQVALGEASSC